MNYSKTKEVNALCCIVQASWICIDCRAMECASCYENKQRIWTTERVGRIGHFTSCDRRQDFWDITSLEAKGIENA